MKIVSAVCAPAVTPLINSRIAVTARINRTPLSFWQKCQSGSDRIFFLPSGGVFIESAHTVSAARATLTICSSETATNFCQFYRGEKLAVADQFQTASLTLWRTFSRAGQIGCH